MSRSSFASRLVACAALAGLSVATRMAAAEEALPPDVAIKLPAPPQRTVTVEWNPLALFTIGRVSANVVITPGDHHALILSPFYAWVTTHPIDLYSGVTDAPSVQLPTQRFKGFGGELGYRYYFAKGGPRGLFLGPSLILGSFDAKAQDGTSTSYLDFGLAADIGYQVLVADRVSLSLGAGLQYTATNKSIPDQQFPAEIYANDGLRPRVLASLGWAF
jgi:hypothetical protein